MTTKQRSWGGAVMFAYEMWKERNIHPQTCLHFDKCIKQCIKCIGEKKNESIDLIRLVSIRYQYQRWYRYYRYLDRSAHPYCSWVSGLLDCYGWSGLCCSDDSHVCVIKEPIFCAVIIRSSLSRAQSRLLDNLRCVCLSSHRQKHRDQWNTAETRYTVAFIVSKLY